MRINLNDDRTCEIPKVAIERLRFKFRRLKEGRRQLEGERGMLEAVCKSLGDDRIRLIKERDKLKAEVERLNSPKKEES